MKFYQYPKCSTCRKAAKYLDSKGVQFESIEITEQPPSQDELLQMLANYDGNIRKLFNTSGLVYRELNLKESLPSMSEQDAIKLLSENGKLIKRPFLLLENGKGLVGFKESDWDELVS
jgi:arsenate reductase